MGCALKKEKEPEFNPIVYDPEFQALMESRPIWFVAPASGADIKKVEKLKSTHWVNIPENWLNEDLKYHSNTDEARFQFLKNAFLKSPPNAVVWTLRGGYGSARLIRKLEQIQKPEHERIFIGYSDITALHLFLSQKWQWKPIHGAALSELVGEKDPDNFKRIADILSRKVSTIELDDLKPLNKLAAKSKKISGLLTGGNMTLVQTSIGTPWQIDAQNKILFLEDHKEQGYKIDRALYHLKEAGILNGVKAIVFGNFETGVKDEEKEEIDFALDRFAHEIQIPVFKSAQFGHGKVNRPLIYHANSEIKRNAEESGYRLVMRVK